MNIQKKDKGFTIIEVVLVLAIAGLIFMMVFVALPALQRGQRDAQRKSDLSRAVNAITKYSSDNRGSLPTFNAAFVSSYLTTAGDSFIDPSGANTVAAPAATSYTFTSNTTATTYPTAYTSTDTQNTIYYASGYTCGSGGAISVAGSRKVALRMALEGGGVTCQNN